MFKAIKKWLQSDGEPHYKKIPNFRPETKQETHDRMVGEPVTSFIASLHREPKRYKIERVLKLNEFPGYTCYNWMHKGAGTWKLTDRKTGKTYGAYIHDAERLYAVYGLPFDLNWWELKALYEAFGMFRFPARTRLAESYTRRCERAREAKWAQEKLDRAEYAKQFQE